MTFKRDKVAINRVRIRRNAKKQLNVSRRKGVTLLAFPWDNDQDTVGVRFPQEKTEPSKRGILSKVAKIYDPLQLASPISSVTCV